MRHLILFVTLFFSLQCSLKAQQHTDVANEIARFVNQSDPAGLFNLFDSTFQQQFPLAEVNHAVPSLQNAFGTFKEVKMLKEKGGQYLYRFEGTKGGINVVLSFNKGKLASMLFTPEDPFFTPAKREKWPTDNRLHTALDQAVDSIVRAVLVKSNTPSVSIGILQKGKTYLYNYGEVSLNGGPLPTSESVYEIGSVTKTFTGTVLSHLLRTGKVSLEDRVNKYLPDTIPPLGTTDTPLLIKHLVSHTAGLPHQNEKAYGAKVSEDMDNQMKYYGSSHILAFLQEWKPFETPGTHFRYSNLGYAILGYICERVTGKTMSELYRQWVFEPVGMTRTFLNDEQPVGKVLPYRADGSPAQYYMLDAYSPAGAIRSNVSDMLKYLRLQLQPGNTGVGRDIAFSHTPVMKTEMSLAIGWFLGENEKGKFYFHSGGTGGFTSRVAYQPATQTGIVVFSNCLNGDANEIGDLVFRQINH